MLASRLGELLVRERLITAAQLEEALTSLRNSPGSRLIDIIIAQGLIDERALLELLAKAYRMPIMDLANLAADKELVAMMPTNFWMKNAAIPVGRRGDTLVIAV